MRRVCVFCGSSDGTDPRIRSAAEELGRLIAARGWGLVYGGAAIGLMGRIADAVLAAGGEVVGVLPGALMQREVGHPGLTEMHVVHTMHERKATMADLSDAFVALPGGLGTLEELFEVLTWSQLGIHRKPCGLLDVGGYYGSLLEFLETAIERGFVARANRDLLLVESEATRLLDRLESYRSPVTTTWLTADEI